MELLTLKIPLAFIESKLGRPSWQEILFGLENQLIDPNAAVQLAEQCIDSADQPPEVVELAIAEPGEAVLEGVRSLAQSDDRDPETTSQLWLYLA